MADALVRCIARRTPSGKHRRTPGPEYREEPQASDVAAMKMTAATPIALLTPAKSRTRRWVRVRSGGCQKVQEVPGEALVALRRVALRVG